MIEKEIVGIPKAQGATMEVVYIINKTRDFVKCDSPNGVLRFDPGELHDERRKCMKPSLRVHAAPICKRFATYLAFVEQSDAAAIMNRAADLGGTPDAYFAALDEIFGVNAESPALAAAQEKKRQALLAKLARRGLKFDKDEKLEVLEAADTDARAVPGLLRAKNKEEREASLLAQKRKDAEDAERPTVESPEKQEASERTELRARYKELTGEPAPRGTGVNDLKALVAQAEALDEQSPVAAEG